MWTGEYVLDFDEVLTRGPPVPSLDDDEEVDSDRPVFSLVTGRYRHAKRYGGRKLSYFRLWPFFVEKTTS
jgi:diphthamide biosynthesis protein 2